LREKSELSNAKNSGGWENSDEPRGHHVCAALFSHKSIY
jgi:hypothetical protein